MVVENGMKCEIDRVPKQSGTVRSKDDLLPRALYSLTGLSMTSESYSVGQWT
jgi:hypothetical protein